MKYPARLDAKTGVLRACSSVDVLFLYLLLYKGTFGLGFGQSFHQGSLLGNVRLDLTCGKVEMTICTIGPRPDSAAVAVLRRCF